MSKLEFQNLCSFLSLLLFTKSILLSIHPVLNIANDAKKKFLSSLFAILVREHYFPRELYPSCHGSPRKAKSTGQAVSVNGVLSGTKAGRTSFLSSSL